MNKSLDETQPPPSTSSSSSTSSLPMLLTPSSSCHAPVPSLLSPSSLSPPPSPIPATALLAPPARHCHRSGSATRETSPSMARLTSEVARSARSVAPAVAMLHEAIRFPDDFEEYRARATSGGSLYGLFRRHAATVGSSSSGTADDEQHYVRQRSRSLIPRSAPLTDDRSVLHALFDYTEARRYEKEPRRHTSACLESHRLNVPGRALTPSLRRQMRVTPAAEPPPEHEEKPPVLVIPTIQLPEGDSVPDEDDDDDKSNETESTNDEEKTVDDLLSCPSKLTQYRRRSFATTNKGLVNEGDTIVNSFDANDADETTPLCRHGSLRSKQSINRLDSDASMESDSGGSVSVLMLGGPGVGKTALTQQFLTSEYQAAQNTSFDDSVQCSVSVLLNGEETLIGITDVPYTGDPDTWKDYEVDAMVIVYSLCDKRSFKKAVDLLYDIRVLNENRCPITLVGNKSDIVRCRVVKEREGTAMAETYGCDYVEVSAILNHMVDELLVCILSGLRNMRSNNEQSDDVTPGPLQRGSFSADGGCLDRARGCVLKKLLKSGSRSCCDLADITQ